MQEPHTEISKDIVQSIARLWADHELEDFKVEVEGNTINCHSFILASCSDFFKGLFRSGMIECQRKLVPLPNISLETFELILKTLYTGSDVLTRENVFDIWQAADQLQILFLVKHCEKFVIEHLSLATFEHVYRTASFLKSENVLKIIFEFVLRNFTSIVKTGTFLDFEYDFLHRIVRSSDLAVESEDIVVYSIYKWVKHGDIFRKSTTGLDNINCCTNSTQGSRDILMKVGSDAIISFQDSAHVTNTGEGNDILPNSIFLVPPERGAVENESDTGQVGDRLNETNCRRNNLPKLLDAARLCLASSSCLYDIYDNEISQSQPLAWQIINQAIAFKVPNYSHGFWPKQSVYRKCSKLEHVGVVCSLNSCQALPLGQKEWFSMPMRHYQTNSCKLVVHNKELYSCDRRNNNLSSVVSVLVTDNWKDVVDVQGQDYFLLAHDKFIYLISSDKGEISWFDPKQSPIHIDKLNAQLRSPDFALSYHGSILIFCSVTKGNNQNTLVYCWETASDTWSRLENFNGSTRNITSFRDSQNIFLLESRGNLWKVCTTSTVIGFTLLEKLWDHDHGLSGAFLYNEKLVIYGRYEADDINVKFVENVFVSAIYWYRDTENSNFVYFVYPKNYLQKIEKK